MEKEKSLADFLVDLLELKDDLIEFLYNKCYEDLSNSDKKKVNQLVDKINDIQSGK